MLYYLKRKSLVCIMILLFLMSVSGCGKFHKDVQLYGGNTFQYDLCLEECKPGNVSIPIIVNQKVKEIKFNNWVAKDKDLLQLTVTDIDMNDCVKYNDYYIYFAKAEIKCVNSDVPVNISIDELIFEIEGEIIQYKTPHFSIKNACYYCEQGNYLLETENQIYIGGNYTALYGFWPNEDRKLNFDIVVDNEIKIKSYQLANESVIKKLEIAGKSVESDKIDTTLQKDENLAFEYVLDLPEELSEDTIIKASQIITYEYQNQNYIWVYTPGLYIWKDYSEYNNLKRYIDTL